MLAPLTSQPKFFLMASGRLSFLGKHKRLLAKRRARQRASVASNVEKPAKLRRMDRHIEPEDLHSPLPAMPVEDGANSPASIATTLSLGSPWMPEEEDCRLREEDLLREHLEEWENTQKLLASVQLLKMRVLCSQIDVLLSQLPRVEADNGSN